MLKLKIDFEVTLPAVSDAFSQSIGTTHLLPFEGGRAVVFGWGTNPGLPHAGPSGYWLAELTRDGATTRVLPEAMTHNVERLVAQQNPEAYLQAFQLGARFGILLAPEALLLFDHLQAEPARIAIEGHFSGLGELAHSSHASDSHYEVVHCGPGTGNCVPVVLASPTSRGAGRSLALLEIDPDAKTARWRHTLPEGGPRTLQGDDYSAFDRNAGSTASLAQIDSRAAIPIVNDCAWLGQEYLVYTAGFNKNYNRFGAPLSVLTRNHVNLSVMEPVFQAADASLARIGASLDRLVLSPLNKTGPRKGKQTLVTLADRQEHAITPPRGYTGHQVLACDAGYYWMAPQAMGYNRVPVTMQVCREG